jgi:antitoxin (DNA-binding transcriptional repressor) of toxin-antitoxin stability system
MRKKISATEAVRKFSEILSQVHYKGESYTVLRGGKSVASISPVTEPLEGKNLGELKRLLAAIPKLGAEAETFEADIRAARESLRDYGLIEGLRLARL